MLVATATVSLGGLTGSVAGRSAQETDPLEGEDVSLSFSGGTMTFGRAALTYEDGVMRFSGHDWTAEGAQKSLSGDEVEVTVSEVSAEAFATVRAAAVDAKKDDSPVPLLVGISKADIDPDADIEMHTSGVEQDGQVVADGITATGTFESVVPDELRKLSKGTLLGVDAVVGESAWDRMTVKRGDTELEFHDVTITPKLSGAKVDGKTRFDISFGEIMKDGQQLVSNFETSGTLAELLAGLASGTVPEGTPEEKEKDAAEEEGDTAEDGELDKIVIVSSPDTDVQMDYVFEVTGDVEKLEPDEDVGDAVDEIVQAGDRVRVEGTVGTGDDRFAFSGELIEVDVPPEVTLDVQDR